MPAPETHERLGPSSSGRWIPCSFSLGAQDEPNERMQEGTEAHAYAADVLLSNKTLGDVPTQFREAVRIYADTINDLAGMRSVERKWMSASVPEFGGTIDCVVICDNIATVCDFKFGTYPVDAENNSQLLCYATLIRDHFPVDQFWGIIVQPRAFKGPKVKTAGYSLPQLDNHLSKVEYAANNTYKRTGDWCRFCPLRKQGTCQEGIDYGSRQGWKS